MTNRAEGCAETCGRYPVPRPGEEVYRVHGGGPAGTGSPAFGQQRLDQGVHLVDVERVFDRAYPEVFSDHDVAGVGVADAAGEREPASAAVLVREDRKRHPGLLDEGLHQLRRVAVVDAEYENVFASVALMDRAFDVWKLQTANRSEQGEVRQHDHLAAQALDRAHAAGI